MGTKKLEYTRTAAAKGHPPRGWQQLWQVPALLVGLLVLTGVCLSRPLFQTDDRWVQDRNLEIARRLLFQPDCTPEKVRELVARSLATDKATPERAGEAHLLLGSAYLRMVNLDCQAPVHSVKLNADTAKAIKHARKHLEKAEQFQVPEPDQAKLKYRLGKVWFLSDHDPHKVVAALAGSVEAGASDNLAEGYSLLTQAYLRLPTPDLKAALEANKKQMNLPIVKESMMAPPRLLRGELLLRMDDPAGAREVLQFIKPPAPPAMIAHARFLQAKSFQDEHEWLKASKLWLDALTHRKPGSPEAGQILYYLGVCHRNLEELDKAGPAWEKALQTAPEAEAVAAALSLAELRLLDSKPEAAVEALRRAVKDVKSSADWKNPFWDLNHTRDLFERGCLILHATDRYEPAIQTAEVYEAIAPPGATVNLIAQAAEAAAKSKLDQARQAVAQDVARPLEERARELFLLAAAKHESAAEHLVAPEQCERLWQAAECLVYGRDYTNAVRLLDKLAKQGPPADRAAQVWFLLAEAQRALKQDDAALFSYTESASHRGPYAYRARYQLAVVEMNRGQVDRAADALERNLRDLSLDPDSEAHQKTLYELGGLLYRRKAYQVACQRLEEAMRLFPAAPEAVLARYQLGECYRALALMEIEHLKREERKSPETEALHTRLHREKLSLAVAVHEELLRHLNAKLAAGGQLSDEEDGLYWRATLAGAECRADLGDYQGPIASYENLAKRYPGRIEALYALAGVARCSFLDSNDDKAREALGRMKTLVESMAESAFPTSPGMMTKLQWQQWISERMPRKAEPTTQPPSGEQKPGG